MRQLVWMLLFIALAGCTVGGAAHTALPPLGGSTLDDVSAARGAESVRLSTGSIAFTAVGWHATQIVTTTWRDGSRKSAVSSDPAVVAVSPPYQLAEWTAPHAFTARYWITPVSPGKATITFSDHNGRNRGQLAVTVTATPSGTLYVAGNNVVKAYPAGANGPVAPQRTITGFNERGVMNIRIATASNGDLYVISQLGATPRVASCDVTDESSTADGAAGVLMRFNCPTPLAGTIARGANGQMDVDVINGSHDEVYRFANGSQLSKFVLGPATGEVATDAAGNLYVTTEPNRIDEYTPDATNGATPMRTITFGAGVLGAVAVSANGTLHAVRKIGNANGLQTEYIDAVEPGMTTTSRSMGPYTKHDVLALACDDLGEVYAAFHAWSGSDSEVLVYAGTAEGSAPAVRGMPYPGGVYIQGLAIYQDAQTVTPDPM